MNHNTIQKLHKRWGATAKALCDQLDANLVGTRGPNTAVSTYSLVAGLVYLALEHQPVHVRHLERTLATARQRDLKLLGLATRPTYKELRYRFELLERSCEQATNREQAIQELLDILIPSSTTSIGQTRTWAVDTHLFEAWVNQAKATSTDPDATWRVLDTHKHRNHPVLGYQLVAAVRADGGTEICDRIRIITANKDDAPTAVNAINHMVKTGIKIERILADRGFTQKPRNFLDPIRNQGIHITFDLKETDLGVSGTYKGNLVIDGWLHSPATPKHLQKIKRPGQSAGAAAHTQFANQIAQRQAYMFAPHTNAGPNSARVASPATRNRLKCKILKNTAPNAAPTCRINHAPDEGCAVKTTTFNATTAPRTYQWPAWGTPDWITLYRKRSSVERFFGHLQSDTGPGFKKGRWRLRRLTKVAIATAAFVIATNINLIEAAAQKTLKAATAVVKKTRSRKYTVTVKQATTTRTRGGTQP